MAKRFIDTQLFRKPDIRALQAPYKLLYIYMFCECDHAGIWDVELDIAGIRLGFGYDEIEVLKIFKGRIRKIDNSKWYLEDFIEFQYGKLNPENRAHKSVIALLSKNKIKPLRRPSQGCKDMDKDKLLDKEGRVPTIEQWLEYAKSQGYPEGDARNAFDHYEANGWVQGSGSKKIKDWKACQRTCSSRYFRENPNAKPATGKQVSFIERLSKAIGYRITGSDLISLNGLIEDKTVSTAGLMGKADVYGKFDNFMEWLRAVVHKG